MREGDITNECLPPSEREGDNTNKRLTHQEMCYSKALPLEDIFEKHIPQTDILNVTLLFVQ